MSSDAFKLRRQAIAAVLKARIGAVGRQNILAQKSGIDPTAVSEYIAAKRTAGEPQLRKLASALEIPWKRLWILIGDEQVRIAGEEEEERTDLDEVHEGQAEEVSRHESGPPTSGIEQALRAIMLDALREVLPPLLRQELLDYGLIRVPESRKTGA